MSGTGNTDLPRWRCHKEVSAAKIMQMIDRLAEGKMDWLLDGGVIVTVDRSIIARGCPAVGDFYVRYDADGYESWSPAKAFEEGYSRIPEVASTPGSPGHA